MNAADLETDRQRWTRLMYAAGWRTGTAWDDRWGEFDWYYSKATKSDGTPIIITAAEIYRHWQRQEVPSPF